MKILTRRFLTTLASACLLLTVAFAAGQSEWKLAAKSKDHSYWYNASRLKTTAPGVKQAWIKETPRNATVRVSGAIRFNDPGYRYRVTLEEFNCQSLTHRTLKATAYAADGRVIDHADFRDVGGLEWKETSPESVGEDTLHAVCSGLSRSDKAVLERLLDSMPNLKPKKP